MASNTEIPSGISGSGTIDNPITVPAMDAEASLSMADLPLEVQKKAVTGDIELPEVRDIEQPKEQPTLQPTEQPKEQHVDATPSADVAAGVRPAKIIRKHRGPIKNLVAIQDLEVDIDSGAVTVVITFLAVASILLAIYVMYIEASLVFYVAFAFPILIAPYVVHQRQKVQWMTSFEDYHNYLRNAVNEMALETNQLINEVSRLERSRRRLEAVEGRFEQIVKREGRSVDASRKLVRENAVIIKEIQQLQAADDIQTLISTVLRSDKDGDYKVSDDELDQFLRRLNHCCAGRPGRNGNRFDEEAIRSAFKLSLTRTVKSLLQITASAAGGEGDKEQQETVDGSDGNHGDNDRESPPPNSDIKTTDSKQYNAPVLPAAGSELLDGLLSSDTKEFQSMTSQGDGPEPQKPIASSGN